LVRQVYRENYNGALVRLEDNLSEALWFAKYILRIIKALWFA
jgi:hypothetical protein